MYEKKPVPGYRDRLFCYNMYTNFLTLLLREASHRVYILKCHYHTKPERAGSPGIIAENVL